MSILPATAAIAPPTEQMREYTADSKEMRRMSVDPEAHPGLGARQWGFEARLDPNVTYEEFIYWAKIERELEKEEKARYSAVTKGQGFIGGLKGYFTSNAYEDAKIHDDAHVLGATTEKQGRVEERGGVTTDSDDNGFKPVPPSTTHGDLDAQWRKDSRALRTAGWGAIFYLITTDILGWGQTPSVFAADGFGLGVGVFLLLGIAAGASGLMIWRTFLALDSSRFPMVTFGDPFFRLIGGKTRHFINVLQSLQMFLSVAIVQLGQTYIIAQLAGSADLCFAVCGIISLVVGMASGYMRALKHLGWFCNAAVWINIVTFIIIMVAAGINPPDPVPAVSSGVMNKAWEKHPVPVVTFTGTPLAKYQQNSHNLFAAKFGGINSIVYAYSGAILFLAFLSEMRHPQDFWKAMVSAQTFITVVYIFFGAFVYAYWGQYAYVNINQVVTPLSLQVVGNVLSLLTGWLAIFLYFNVGMKTVYVEVCQEIMKLPPITTKKGGMLWWTLGPVYWILAFVVAMSVPFFGQFSSFVGGLFSLNFTYSFAGFMYMLVKMQEGAILPGEGFDPATGITTRHDNGMKRWIRGFNKKAAYTYPALIFTLAGMAASGMGSWSGVLQLQAAAGAGGSVLTSWTCVNPYYTGN